MNEAIQLIEQSGGVVYMLFAFPMVISIYQMTTLKKSMDKNTEKQIEVLNELKAAARK